MALWQSADFMAANTAPSTYTPPKRKPTTSRLSELQDKQVQAAAQAPAPTELQDKRVQAAAQQPAPVNTELQDKRVQTIQQVNTGAGAPGYVAPTNPYGSIGDPSGGTGGGLPVTDHGPNHGGSVGTPGGPPSGGGPSFDYGSNIPNVAAMNDLRQRRLSAALEAISAQFGFQRGGMQGQLRALEALFQREMAESERAGQLYQEDTDDRYANRGLLHSGRYGRDKARGFNDMARIQADLTGRLSGVAGAEGTDVRDLMSAIALLSQQEAAANASAQVEFEQDELDMEQMIALFNAGL